MSTSSRTAGVTVSLSALRTGDDWGVGQVSALVPFAKLVAGAGFSLVQILPPYELSAGETSPYGARTAFGIDPLYVTVERIPELDEGALAAFLSPEVKAEILRLRSLERVDFTATRALKERALGVAFSRFVDRELSRKTARAAEFGAFVARARWARELALYVALRDSHAGYGWSTWPEAERDHTAEVTRHADSPNLETPLGRAVLEHLYRQFLLEGEWKAARAELAKLGVELMGDLPFVVGSESADVWANRADFRLDVSLGAPPDAFSADGQDWGLPAYDFASLDAKNLQWIRERTAHAATLYDRFRLDHAIGYFRQWVKPHGEKGRFIPDAEPAQKARGEKVLSAIVEAAHPAKVIAEDLGVIPDFARESLLALKIPGYRVLPWDRADGVYARPEAIPEMSVASWSTHDTAPITSWWDELETWERDALVKNWNIGSWGSEDERNLLLLGALFSARSELSLVLVQEILFDKTRVNTPGVVGPENWTYKLPRTVEELASCPDTAARFARIRALVEASGRGRS